MDLSIHEIKSIKETPIEDFSTFFVRRIIIESERNEKFIINLFSDRVETLKIIKKESE
jgi:hypothetical protein